MTYQYTIYRAKKDNTGLAASFQASKDLCYLKLAKQQQSKDDNDSFAWQRKGDNPDPSKHLNVKLGLQDLGNMLGVLNNSQAETKLYHEYLPKEGEKIVTQIFLSKFVKDGVFRGYSLMVNRSQNKYALLLSCADVENIKLLFSEAVMMQLFHEVK
jgi:hypothetical protein